MKRVLFSVAALVASLPVAAQAWAPVGATWTYKQGSCCGPDTTLLVLEVVSDTLISGRTFNRLEVNEGWFGCHEFVQFFSESNDSLIYFNTNSGQHHLLFRWNALVGESWSTPVEQIGYLDTLDWSVLDTGLLQVNGTWFRTLDVVVNSRGSLLFSYGGTVIERLGGLGTPFTWILGFCDGEAFQGLRCYSDSIITWQNPDVPQCALGTSVPELNVQGFRVVPNLLERGEALTVDLGDRMHAEGLTVRLTDLSGRVLSEAPIAGTRTTLQVDASGAFLVILLKNGRPIGRQRVVVR